MTTSSSAVVVGGRKAVTVVAAFFVSGIALGSFALSFAALSELASMSGIPESIAWVWPLIVDGSIVTAMLVIFAWRGASRRETAWPWTTLIFFAAVSVVGNGVHTVAVIDGTTGVSVSFAVFVGAIPPVSLLLSSEMLVRIMTGPRARVTDVAVEPVNKSNPEPEPPLQPVPVPVPVAVSVAADAVPVVAVEREPVSVSAMAEPNTADVEGAVEPELEPAPAQEEGVTPVEVPLPGLIEMSVAADAEPINVQENEPETAEAVERESVSVVEPAKSVTATGWAPTVIQGSGVPEGKAAQLEFIIARARAGEDISKATLADLLEVSDRTAFRRLADAKALAPDAFDESNSDAVIGVAK